MWKSGVVIAALLMAGCAAPPQDSNEPQEFDVITDPTDYSYLDQETDGEGYHLHDYWQGRENLTILEDRYECMGCTRSSSGEDAAATMADMRPPGGAVVPQGSRWVHVDVAYASEGPDTSHGDVELWIQGAADPAPVFVAAVASGGNHTMEIPKEQSDPPHNQLSGWRFVVKARPESGSQVTVQDWWVELGVVVERGWDIEPWPPHPDHWNGATELELFEEVSEVTVEANTGNYHTCFGGCFSTPLPIHDGIIIPPDADRVEVVLEHDVGVPLPFKLRYHAGDTWEFSEPTPAEESPTRSVYVIDVDHTTADGPYSLQSVWEFQVASALEPPYAYSGAYTATGTVYKG